MDTSIGLSLAKSLLQVLGSPIYTEIGTVYTVESQIEKLKTTISTINDFLLDAEKEERRLQGKWSHIESGRLKNLKEALYQADDLFDAINTLALQKEHFQGNTLLNAVCIFFSTSNQLWSAFSSSWEIRKIRDTLDYFVKDQQLVSTSRQQTVVLDAIRGRINPRETHSFLSEDDVIIGRDEDKRVVREMIQGTSAEKTVSFISVVGIGGMGKTTLAKHVYNDQNIVMQFPLKIWICVSDDFDVKLILSQILVAATKNAVDTGLSLDVLQQKFRLELGMKRYLLVLDDLWNEDEHKWHNLKSLLISCGRSSRVLVTTRSRQVAKIVGGKTHELKGLSEKDSWKLFERMTHESGQHQMESHLVDIGKEIVKKCVGVPLALRVLGRLLQGQNEDMWQYVKNTELANIPQDEEGILPVLKISYYYLPFHLKSCFNYCAIFPKDAEIVKEKLIYLWMAQGYIMPSYGESLENEGEVYFMKLLQRCFFQDVTLGVSGEIISCKMHDLIHDVAKEVAGTEILSSNISQINDKTRHLFFDNTVNIEDVHKNMRRMRRMRTLMINNESFGKSITRVHVRYLRVLELRRSGLSNLPSTIGSLLHLRYLDLSCNIALRQLPSSITNLHNLQTLNLYNCCCFKMLPRDLSKLVNLRKLDIYRCDMLSHMPRGMSSMASLHKFTAFVVNTNTSNWWSMGVGELSEMKILAKNHSELLRIVVRKDVTYDAVIHTGRKEYLLSNEHLRRIEIMWEDSFGDLDSEGNSSAEALLENLQPHRNLRKLMLSWYLGLRFPPPRWDVLEIFLPNLVTINLERCKRLKYLTVMSQLCHLEFLKLVELSELEYMESSTSSRAEESVFFPSLKHLILWNMYKLKGWWKEESKEIVTERGNSGVHIIDIIEEQQQQRFTYSFPQLSSLEIFWCPAMTTFPLCPKLEKLDLRDFNRALNPIIRGSNDGGPSSSNKNRKKQVEEGVEGLRNIDIDDLGYLNSLPVEAFHYLSSLRIRYFHMMGSLTTGQAGIFFQRGHISSLRTLSILNCEKLNSVSGQGVWEHLTALETLTLEYLDELTLEDEEEENRKLNEASCSHSEFPVTPWRFLSRSLRSLYICGLPKLKKLPKGLHKLTSLQSLEIAKCQSLKSLSEEMRHLTSLQRLILRDNSKELEARCKERDGVDFPNIKHIPERKIILLPE